MRLSTMGRYALRAMVDLALHQDQVPVLRRDIAKRQELSSDYLAQLLVKLSRAGLVTGTAGPGGGYVLAREAGEISAIDVLEAVGETLDLAPCVQAGQETDCQRVDGCPTHWLWARLGRSIHGILDAVTLADLCQRSRDPTFDIGEALEEQVEAETGASAGSCPRLPTVLNSLEAAQAFQRSIIDSVGEPIMVIGADYRVKLMNRAARAFSSGDACMPEPVLCYQISHRREVPCTGSEHPCPLQRVRESGQTVTVVHEHYRANGERRTVEVIASPLWGEDGALQGIIESIRDVTGWVRA